VQGLNYKILLFALVLQAVVPAIAGQALMGQNTCLISMATKQYRLRSTIQILIPQFYKVAAPAVEGQAQKGKDQQKHVYLEKSPLA